MGTFGRLRNGLWSVPACRRNCSFATASTDRKCGLFLRLCREELRPAGRTVYNGVSYTDGGEAAAENVRAVAGRAHPRLDNSLWCALTIGDVFAGTRVGNAGLGQRGKAGCAARTCVRKAGLQFSGAGLRRLLHRGADGQRGQSLPGTLGVYQRDHLRGVAAVRGGAL